MRFIEIKLTKCTLFLTEEELSKLLSQDIELFKIGIKRGKNFLRSKKQNRREQPL